VAKVEALLETDAGVPFFVMELLEGESLRALLKRHVAPSRRRDREALHPRRHAVIAAHAQGIIHRDSRDGPRRGHYVRVLDFGIAETSASGATRSRRPAQHRTPLYEVAAPRESFADENRARGRSDADEEHVLRLEVRWMILGCAAITASTTGMKSFASRRA